MSKITVKRRTIQITSDIAGIPLTRGEIILIDAKYASYLEQWNWCTSFSKGLVYAKRRQNINGVYRDIKFHRVVMSLILGRELLDTEHVDHIDGDGCNNVADNLRVATVIQNHQNRRLSKNNTSGYNGVHRDRKRWCAVIHEGGKCKYLGGFDTPELAHEAFCKAAKEIRGEFASFRR